MASEESGSPPRPPPEPNRIKVLVRLKPVPEARACCIAAADATGLVFSGSAEAGALRFDFDRVLPGPTGQAEVFAQVRPVVAAALAGGTGTIFSYGQTGSGKTHTLVGDLLSAEQQGIVPRAAAELFSAAAADDGPGGGLTVRASAAEIYCERIRDLLSFTDGSDNLAVTQDRDGSVLLAGAQQQEVRCAEELLDVMTAALANRAVAATGMNAASSRSHCLVLLAVQRRLPGGRRQCGKLWLVDLAGSERQGRTQATGKALEEAKLINRSLSALGNVVSALAEAQAKRSAGHVPYRDSKLTRLLQDSLGGAAKTAIVVCCSPAAEDAGESLAALRFGARAAGIVNAQPVQPYAGGKAGKGAAEAAALAEQLTAAQEECERLRSEKAALLSQLQAGQEAAALAEDSVSGHERAVLLVVRTIVLLCLVLSHLWP